MPSSHAFCPHQLSSQVEARAQALRSQLGQAAHTRQEYTLLGGGRDNADTDRLGRAEH